MNTAFVSLPLCRGRVSPAATAPARCAAAPARTPALSSPATAAHRPLRAVVRSVLGGNSASNTSSTSAFFGSSLPPAQRAQARTTPANDTRKDAPNAPVRMDVTIVVGDSEPIESAIRRFKKDVTKSGHLFELRRRRYFETATEKRIRKAAASKRKARIARNSNNRSEFAA